MENDTHKVRLARGTASNLGRVQNKEIRWADVVDRLSQPYVDASLDEIGYRNASKDRQNTAKAEPGFLMAGHCEGGVRRDDKIISRSMITLDLDEMDDDELMIQLRSGFFEDFEFECFVHTTRSHGAGKPRIRILLPLAREITDAEEYNAVARLVAERLDRTMNAIDACSFRFAQMMYMPSISRGQEFVCACMPGTLLDPDMILEECTGDWRDLSNLPRAEREMAKIRKAVSRAQRSGGTGDVRLMDPRNKSGVVGAVCRAYDVATAIERFIPGVYVASTGRTASHDRLTYAEGSTTNGAVIYGDGTHLYSFHATDPAGEQALNAFDLVRIHRFGELDEGLEHAATTPTDLESHHAMTDLALNDPAVQAQLTADQAQADDFDMSFFDDEEGDAPMAEIAEDSGLADALLEGGDDAGDEELVAGVDPLFADLEEDEPFAEVPVAKEEPKAPAAKSMRMMAAMKPTAQTPEAKARAEALIESAEEAGDDDWKSMLDVDAKKGELRKTLFNANLIVANDPALTGAFALNAFIGDVIVKRDLEFPVHSVPKVKVEDQKQGDIATELHASLIRAAISAPPEAGGYGLSATVEDIKASMVMAGSRNQFHPVRDRLEALEWDGEARAERLFVDYVGADDNAYHREIARNFLVGAVARCLEPGHKFDFSPVLEGPQGTRKSTFWKVLAYGHFAELSEAALKNTEKGMEIMKGAWILEIPEMGPHKSVDPEKVKAFMSATHDKGRLAYRRDASNVGRQCVFGGTSNEGQYLTDRTGNRRIWPIETDGKIIRTEKLKEELDQIWAEAVAMYREMRAEKPAGDLDLSITSVEARRQALAAQRSRMVHTAETDWRDLIIDALNEGLTDGGNISAETAGSFDEKRVGDRVVVMPRYVDLKFLWVTVLGESEEDWVGAEGRKNQGELSKVLSSIPGIRKGKKRSALDGQGYAAPSGRVSTYDIDYTRLPEPAEL